VRPVAQGAKQGAKLGERSSAAPSHSSTGPGSALPGPPGPPYGPSRRKRHLREGPEGGTMAVSDARRLKVYEQARAHWGEETAEVLMELVVPTGQDMATKADVERLEARMDGLATKEYVLRMLLITLAPLYLGILGLYFTG
jgi:hypothetical protein